MNLSTSIEYEHVSNAYLSLAIASMPPHKRTIQQRTPTSDTHKLDHQDGVQRPERETILIGTAPTPT